MFKNKPQFYNKYIVAFFFLQIAPLSGYFFLLENDCTMRQSRAVTGWVCGRELANKKSLLIQNFLLAAQWRQFELTNCDINMSGISRLTN